MSRTFYGIIPEIFGRRYKYILLSSYNTNSSAVETNLSTRGPLNQTGSDPALNWMRRMLAVFRGDEKMSL